MTASGGKLAARAIDFDGSAERDAVTHRIKTQEGQLHRDKFGRWQIRYRQPVLDEYGNRQVKQRRRIIEAEDVRVGQQLDAMFAPRESEAVQ